MLATLDVLPVTSGSPSARDAHDHEIVALLAGRAEAEGHAKRALDEDPNLAMAWVVLAIVDRFGGRMADASDKVRHARACADGISEREENVLRFFEHFGRDNSAAEAIAVAHLRDHPRDHLIVLYMHYLYNIAIVDAGRRDRHAALFRFLAGAWPDDDWFLQSELAFVESEDGQHARALELARGANELRPDAGGVAHAFAHALLETGRVDEGITWLTSWLTAWAAECNQACHLTWHHALFGLAAADEAAVARRLDDILGYAGRSISALSDGASLMWRLHLDGASRSSLAWQALASLPSPPGFAFSNLHRGFVLAGLGDVDVLRTYAQTVTFPGDQACLGLADFIAEEPVAAADRLLEHESDFVAIGGSRAQLEVLDDTLIAALALSGRADHARRRLEARLTARASARDDRWLASLSS